MFRPYALRRVEVVVCLMGTSKDLADKARRSEKSGVYIMVNEHFRARRNAVSEVFRGAHMPFVPFILFALMTNDSILKARQNLIKLFEVSFQ
jgi:hypothetical protein